MCFSCSPLGTVPHVAHFHWELGHSPSGTPQHALPTYPSLPASKQIIFLLTLVLDWLILVCFFSVCFSHLVTRVNIANKLCHTFAFILNLVLLLIFWATLKHWFTTQPCWAKVPPMSHTQEQTGRGTCSTIPSTHTQVITGLGSRQPCF